jgi:hypothetical protein
MLSVVDTLGSLVEFVLTYLKNLGTNLIDMIVFKFLDRLKEVSNRKWFNKAIGGLLVAIFLSALYRYLKRRAGIKRSNKN